MCASGTLAIDEELNAILQSHQHHPDVPLRMQMVTSTVDSSLQGLPPVRSSQLSLNGGFLSGLFGSHSPEHQRVAPSTSTTRLVNSIDAFIQQRCTQSSGTSGEAASEPQARKPHSHEKRQSSRSSGDRMDIDEESPGRNLPGSTVMLGPHKSSLAESIQSSGGLMRYHSAPSSTLPSHVEVGEDIFPRVSCPMKQTDDSDFARFFVDDVSPATANSGSRGTQPVEKSQTGCAPAGVEAEQQLLRNSDLDRKLPQQSRYRRPSGNGIVEELNRVPLSAIYEHGPDLSPDNFYSSQISVTGKQRGARKGHTVGVGSLVSESSSLNPHISSSAGFTATPENRSNLIRHRSSPAGLLSRLAKEVQGESGERPGPCFTGPLMQPPAECLPERISEETAFGPSARRPEGAPGFPVTSSYVEARLTGDTCNDHVANVGVLGLPSVPINNCLLRQSSSPAGLPSQLTLDGIAEGCDKLVMPSLHRNSAEEVGYDRRGGHVTFLSSYPIEGWDEEVAATGDAMVSMQNGTAFAARKRVREMEAKMFPGLTSSDLQQRDVSELGPLSNQFSITTTSPERALTAEKFAADSVLCRARAKRGCATHPRSIAERVRRTKISERMRKLQELVPNMDKQTNIADMLDEAVEYVKLLQRQIQELSENRPKCDGSCKKQ